jgi:hypothetical protein
MDSKIDFASAQGVLQLSRKQALAPNLRQGAIQAFVTLGNEVDQFTVEVGPMMLELVDDMVCLP